jgi:ATP-dependent DNA helicase RecG
MLRRTEDKLVAHNRVAFDVTSAPTHIITPDYPLPALQQLLYNAVLHRNYEGTNAPVRVYWYDDRVEINSPGGPYGAVTIDNFGRPGITDYRNPNIADVMKTLGFVQAFGRGLGIARNALSKNKNPPLCFEVTQKTVLFKIRRDGQSG